MRKQTTFEKLEIEYQEIDGIFYPVLSVPTEEEQEQLIELLKKFKNFILLIAI